MTSPNAPPTREVLDAVVAALVSQAGGYLRNPVRRSGVTCAVCTTPSDGAMFCGPCWGHRRTPGVADLVCALTYVFGGTQSGYLMRLYKGQTPQEQHQVVLAALMFLGGSLHSGCAERIVGRPFTHWSFVPSLPAKQGEHPFRRFASRAARGLEVPLRAAQQASNPRMLSVEHFQAAATLPPGSHVLLMDDTWTQGGHAQSAALALRTAGAGKVSIMVAARWINPGYGTNQDFIRTHLTSDFNPRICPWTEGLCPAPTTP
ncbi:hypothetical protein Aph01nite_58080 [Acrocarpospora phusangensis]|uniref:Phosphoribosyltransferase domain-containing protein n=1 Tax=Acrocarpospora phusangensis TaxID=1070424 RepID=A0A919URI2_9ACTN|nr:hypothetical protein [Acrocarpospora phusangensis]GIH27498.1 hypothetical protein Aph01nite_58080 [Acrocarpospora phusangensis]